jgi:hypothetical protein
MAIRYSVGTSTANSYISVAAANTYFDVREQSAPWQNITSTTEGTSTAATTRKENLLIQATRELDRNLRFFGTKYNTGIVGDSANYQNLEFPRSTNLDNSGNEYILEEVKNATCEQALWLLERGGKRTNEDGVVIEKQLISDTAKMYLKFWIQRQIPSAGNPPWRGSNA